MSQKRTDEFAIEMFVGGLLLDPNTQAPVVILKDETGQIALPIWIGVAEATSIASAIKQIAMARPLTHDLMYEAFVKLDIKIERIVITELRESTYFSELVISQGDKVSILDSRPSDAIAIALRASAPILVYQTVLDQARVAFQEQFPVGGGKQRGEVDNAGAENSSNEGINEGIKEEGSTESATEEESLDPDFKNIDKDKWEDLLKKLDPDDFKYKM